MIPAARTSVTVFCSCTLWLACPAAQALPFRCGTEVISMGDTKYQVREACGEPDTARTDEWVYDEGPDGMINVVHFVNDQVSLIEQEPRPD